MTINPNIVATTVPNAAPIETDSAEDLTFEQKTETEVVAGDGTVEIMLSIVDKSFSELVQGRADRLITKKGLYARVKATGFLAGSLAEVWMFSTPRLLAHLQVSANGDAAGYVQIPEDAEIGDHHIEMRGKSKSRVAVRANIPLVVLQDEVPASTIPPTADDLEEAVKLPTEMPALIVSAPTAGVVSVTDDQIKSVVTGVLGNGVDLSKIKLRVRINQGKWIPVDTTNGQIDSIDLPAEAGANNIEFEITPEGGEPIVVQRQVLVEGSAEAVAYTESNSDSGGSWPWPWVLVAVGLGVVVALVGRRKRRA